MTQPPSRSGDAAATQPLLQEVDADTSPSGRNPTALQQQSRPQQKQRHRLPPAATTTKDEPAAPPAEFSSAAAAESAATGGWMENPACARCSSGNNAGREETVSKDADPVSSSSSQDSSHHSSRSSKNVDKRSGRGTPGHVPLSPPRNTCARPGAFGDTPPQQHEHRQRQQPRQFPQHGEELRHHVREQQEDTLHLAPAAGEGGEASFKIDAATAQELPSAEQVAVAAVESFGSPLSSGDERPTALSAAAEVAAAVAAASHAHRFRPPAAGAAASTPAAPLSARAAAASSLAAAALSAVETPAAADTASSAAVDAAASPPPAVAVTASPAAASSSSSQSLAGAAAATASGRDRRRTGSAASVGLLKVAGSSGFISSPRYPSVRSAAVDAAADRCLPGTATAAGSSLCPPWWTPRRWSSEYGAASAHEPLQSEPAFVADSSRRWSLPFSRLLTPERLAALQRFTQRLRQPPWRTAAETTQISIHGGHEESCCSSSYGRANRNSTRAAAGCAETAGMSLLRNPGVLAATAAAVPRAAAAAVGGMMTAGGNAAVPCSRDSTVASTSQYPPAPPRSKEVAGAGAAAAGTGAVAAAAGADGTAAESKTCSFEVCYPSRFGGEEAARPPTPAAAATRARPVAAAGRETRRRRRHDAVSYDDYYAVDDSEPQGEEASFAAPAAANRAAAAAHAAAAATAAAAAASEGEWARDGGLLGREESGDWQREREEEAAGSYRAAGQDDGEDGGDCCSRSHSSSPCPPTSLWETLSTRLRLLLPPALPSSGSPSLSPAFAAPHGEQEGEQQEEEEAAGAVAAEECCGGRGSVRSFFIVKGAGVTEENENGSRRSWKKSSFLRLLRWQASCWWPVLQQLHLVILGILVGVLDNVPYAVLLFPAAAHAQLLPLASAAVTMTVCSSQLVFALFSTFPSAVGAFTVENVPFLRRISDDVAQYFAHHRSGSSGVLSPSASSSFFASLPTAPGDTSSGSFAFWPATPAQKHSSSGEGWAHVASERSGSSGGAASAGTAAIAATSASSFASPLPGVEGDEVFSTTLACWGLSSLLTAAAFYLAGAFKCGNALAKYLPPTLLLGCIGGMGLYIVTAAVGVAADYEWGWTLAALQQIFSAAALPRIAVTLVAEAVLIVGELRASSAGFTPALLLLFPAAFYLFFFLTGMSIAEAREKKWLFAPAEPQQQQPHPYQVKQLSLDTRLPAAAAQDAAATAAAFQSPSLLQQFSAAHAFSAPSAAAAGAALIAAAAASSSSSSTKSRKTRRLARPKEQGDAPLAAASSLSFYNSHPPSPPFPVGSFPSSDASLISAAGDTAPSLPVPAASADAAAASSSGFLPTRSLPYTHPRLAGAAAAPAARALSSSRLRAAAAASYDPSVFAPGAAVSSSSSSPAASAMLLRAQPSSAAAGVAAADAAGFSKQRQHNHAAEKEEEQQQHVAVDATRDGGVSGIPSVAATAAGVRAMVDCVGRRLQTWIHEAVAVFFPALSSFSFSAVSWRCVGSQWLSLAAIVFFSVLHAPINVPSLSLTTDTEASLDYELKVHGLANAATALTGGLQCYMAYSTSTLLWRCGMCTSSHGPCAAIALGLALLLVVLPPATLLLFFPRPAGALLMLHVGVVLVNDGLIASYSLLPLPDYIAVLLTAACMQVAFVEGVLLGFFLAGLLYAARAARRRFYPSSSDVALSDA